MITVTFNKADVQRIEEKLKKLSIYNRSNVLLKAFAQGAVLLERELKQSTRAGRPLHRRTGHLSNSIGSVVVNKKDQLYALIGSGVRTGRRLPYADILETGGTITARRTKYLTIPLPAALTKAGVARKRRARDWPNTFVLRKNGNLYIVQKNGRFGTLKFLYILKKSVEIPAFQYMATTAARSHWKVVDKILDVIRKTLERKNGK